MHTPLQSSLIADPRCTQEKLRKAAPLLVDGRIATTPYVLLFLWHYGEMVSMHFPMRAEESFRF